MHFDFADFKKPYTWHCSFLKLSFNCSLWLYNNNHCFLTHLCPKICALVVLCHANPGGKLVFLFLFSELMLYLKEIFFKSWSFYLLISNVPKKKIKDIKTSQLYCNP